MTSRLAQVNVNVPFNGRHILLKASINTVATLCFIVLLSFINEPTVKPYEFIFLLIAASVLSVFTVYLWTCHVRAKRSILRINSDFIAWVNKHKNVRVKWSFIREVNIVDLSKKGGRSKYVVYDFVLDAQGSKLPSPMSLYPSDYQISHPELLELIEQAAKKYNFQVILDRM
ncbi:hypothetical protein [Glaciecola sp. 33A]|uniref:hypothetical protein n=1 Tax=Glaciecola sp. 33A TaxID=2057807 RepID=UPI000C32CDA6|nr:hypothetical protein [Glaciecola sp. 33A]PKI01080.1 hypothetical protein CXF81_14270 [Glaciecola sp. 33A]